MRAAPLVLAGTIALVPACGAQVLPPNGQLLVYVNTDAMLPAAPGDALGPDEAPPLFDRVRLEVMRSGESEPCADCKREFDVDRTFVGAGHASFGFVPPIGKTGYRARARLFRRAWLLGADPDPDSTVDVTVALPPAEPDRVIEVTIVLRTDDVASPKGQDKPVTPEAGPPQPDLPRSWAPGRRIRCAAPTREGEVCVPGGAYWMGASRAYASMYDAVSSQQRLVVVSPFYIGTNEVTVAALRASGVATKGDPQSGAELEACNYAAAPAPHDGYPANCVSWQKAREYCNTLGGDLPTEAQYEYVAGALTGRAFPWGDDEPLCGDAVFGRDIDINGHVFTGQCHFIGGALAPGSGARDRVRLPGANEDVVDLAGNVAEWMRDEWCSSDSPESWDVDYWTTGVFRDPICNTVSKVASERKRHPIRAGHYGSFSVNLRAIFRQYYDDKQSLVGFRCVRPN